MAGSLNKVTLIGNVGKDPEIRSFQNGNRVASFSIATSQSWKDKTSGEKKEKTEWHNISVLNEVLVGLVEQYVTKGMKMYIEGSMETRKWQDNNGNDRYSTEVVLRPYNGSMLFLSKSGETENNGGQSHQTKAKSAPKTAGGFGAPAPQQQEQAPLPELDDEIPF